MGKESEKSIYGKLREFLLSEWDPIGVGSIPEAEDEYDDYIPGLMRLMDQNSNESGIFQYLWEIETERMGLGMDRQHTERCSEKIARLFDTWQ